MSLNITGQKAAPPLPERAASQPVAHPPSAVTVPLQVLGPSIIQETAEVAQSSHTPKLVEEHHVTKASPTAISASVAVTEAMFSCKYKAIVEAIAPLTIQEQRSILSHLPLSVLREIKKQTFPPEDVLFYASALSELDRAIVVTAVVDKLWREGESISEEEMNAFVSLSSFAADDYETINELLKSSFNVAAMKARELLGSAFVVNANTWTQWVDALKQGSFFQKSRAAGQAISDEEICTFFSQQFSQKGLALARKILTDSQNPAVQFFQKFCVALHEKQEPITQENLQVAVTGFMHYKTLERGNCTEEAVETLLQHFDLQNAETQRLKEFVCRGSYDRALLLQQKLEGTAPSNLTMTIVKNAWTDVVQTLADWQNFASKNEDEQLLLLQKMALCMKNYENDTVLHARFREKIEQFYPAHATLKNIVAKLPLSWQPAIDAKIIEYDLAHQVAPTKEMLDKMRAIQPLPESLVRLFISNMANSADIVVQRFAAWYDFFEQRKVGSTSEKWFANALGATFQRVLILPVVENQTQTQVLQAFVGALPHVQSEEPSAQKVIDELQKFNTVASMNANQLTQCIKAVTSYALPQSLVAQFYEKLKLNTSTWVARFSTGYPQFHPVPTSMEELRRALEAGLKLQDEYTAVHSKPDPAERLRILQQVVLHFSPSEDASLEKYELRLAQCETGQLNLAEFEELLQMPLAGDYTRVFQSMRSYRGTKYQAIIERQKKLFSKHPSWTPQICLQRAVKQRRIIESLNNAPDVSLAALSGLVKPASNLSIPELKELYKIVKNKIDAQAPVAKRITLPAVVGLYSFQQSVTSAISNVIQDKPLTYQKLELIQGVKLTNTQAEALVQAIQEEAVHDTHLNAIQELYTTLKQSWDTLEKGLARCEVILPLACAIHRHLESSTPVQRVADAIVFPFESGQKRTLVTSTGAVAILAKKKISKLQGGGGFKSLFAATLVTKNTPTSSSQATSYRVEPIVRLVSNNPEAISAIEEDVAFLEPLQRELGQQQEPAIFAKRRLEVLHYNRAQGIAEASVFYDRCDAPLDAIVLDAKQQLSVLEDDVRGLRKLHEGEPPKVHADLKPGNLMCTKNVSTGKAHGFIIDFNLSKLASDYAALGNIEYGTPMFSAPEGGRTAAADMFALGTSMYMLAHNGHRPPWIKKALLFDESRNFWKVSSTIARREIILYQQQIETQSGNLIGRVERGSGPLTAEEICDYLTSRMLLIDPQARWTAKKVYDKLQELKIRMKS